MDLDALVARIQERATDPLTATEFAARVRPLRELPPPATAADVSSAEEHLGFALPPFLRRLYREVANGGFGPGNGLYGLPVGRQEPDPNDLIGFYLILRDPPEPMPFGHVWPHGLAPIFEKGGFTVECIDLLEPPFGLSRLNWDEWDESRPLRESLAPVAPSLEERLMQWLASGQPAPRRPGLRRS